jgi:hypothetical protein
LPFQRPQPIRKEKIPKSKKNMLKSRNEVKKEILSKVSKAPPIICRPAIIDMPSGLSELEEEAFF